MTETPAALLTDLVFLLATAVPSSFLIISPAVRRAVRGPSVQRLRPTTASSPIFTLRATSGLSAALLSMTVLESASPLGDTVSEFRGGVFRLLCLFLCITVVAIIPISMAASCRPIRRGGLVSVVLVAAVGSYALFGVTLGWFVERVEYLRKDAVDEGAVGVVEAAVLGWEPPSFLYLDKILGAVMGR
eukprot:CAMPEP_0194334852 /NCGR_PEP_ID=MMETSP0171-20130528/67500_1 /TAXON_ID=218684 /ORGANISM="Corethron pennatum, Strain L29A3" /LENGTH=187 /DNA_ID=CAMNT_0039097677 /DNA_START=39 /DNA_END=602 /DNA_ORIENTATION=-